MFLELKKGEDHAIEARILRRKIPESLTMFFISKLRSNKAGMPRTESRLCFIRQAETQHADKDDINEIIFITVPRIHAPRLF